MVGEVSTRRGKAPRSPNASPRGLSRPHPALRSRWGCWGARRNIMKLRVGYELLYHFPQPTPVIMMLSIHYSRVSDLSRPDHIVIDRSVPISGYRDGFGNWCSRILAPAGAMRISTDSLVS